MYSKAINEDVQVKRSSFLGNFPVKAYIKHPKNHLKKYNKIIEKPERLAG